MNRHNGLQAVALSLLVGLVMEWAGVPAGWFLGALLATLAVALANRSPIQVPPAASLAAQIALGAAVSASFTPRTVETVVTAWPAVLLIIGSLLGMSLLVGLVMARLTRLDAMTVVMGMLPGGAPGMVALSDSLQRDVRLVALMQYVRLFLVISVTALASAGLQAQEGLSPASPTALADSSLSEPWWLGYFTLGVGMMGAGLGVVTRMPAGALVGAAVLGAITGAMGVTHGELPSWVVAGAYLVMGAQVGGRFDRRSIGDMGRLLPAIMGGSMALIGGAALVGWLTSLLTGLDWQTAYLASVPGGLDSVTIIALDTGANAALVFAVSLIRFLAIMVLGPLMVRRLAGGRQLPAVGHGSDGSDARNVSETSRR